MKATEKPDDQLLARAETQWQFGDWESLKALQPLLETEQMRGHPHRKELLLYTALAHYQTSTQDIGRRILNNLELEKSKKNISIILRSVQFHLLRANFLNGEIEKSLRIYRELNLGCYNKDDEGLAFIFYILQSLKDTPLEIVSEGHEAIVYRKGGLIIKAYKPSSFKENFTYQKRGESFFIERLKGSEIYPYVIFSNGLFTVLEYAGEPLGTHAEIKHKNICASSFEDWLIFLKRELKRLKIIHRDIQPSNVLYFKNKKKFYLIDFGWALEDHEVDKIGIKHSALNPFAKNDDESIEKLISIARKLKKDGVIGS